MAVVLFSAGLLFLIAGAEALVRGASRLAAAFGISPLVVGLTVVSFGTSAPELAVSLKATLTGQGNIAVGNVVGSNIFNVLFILGASALIVPLVVSRQLIRLDVPILIGLSVFTLFISVDGRFGRIDGIILVAGLIAYFIFLVRLSRRESAGAEDDEFSREYGDRNRVKGGWPVNTAMVIAGLVLLVLGSRWLVDGAVTFAERLGVSELVIGLTIVTVGTSLPEIVTSLVAAARGERDIAVGNVVGSNIFNLMGVLGLTSLLAPDGVTVSPAVIRFDLPVMVVVAIACLPIFFTGGEISRTEGGLFLAYYGAYTLYLVMSAADHDALDEFGLAMRWFVIPITLISITIIALQQVRRRRRGRATAK